MGNRAALKAVWRKGREEKQRIYAEYENSVNKLEGYRGSASGDRMLKEAREKYESDLAAARAEFLADVKPIMESMSHKASEDRERVTPPNEEQLRILQAVSYIGEGGLSRRDYDRYMEACESSDVAANSLYAMARDKRMEHGTQVEKPQMAGMRVIAILEEIRSSVKSLADWDGTPRDKAMKEYVASRLNGGKHGDPMAGIAGQIDPTASDFEKKVVGMKYDPELMAVLD
jgi:hypothetical protein